MCEVKPSNHKSTKQLLVDISELVNHDACTGIQRVVRGVLLQLLDDPPAGFVVKPVFAGRSHGYRYAVVSHVCLQMSDGARRGALPVKASDGDIFLGLDLAAHLLPKHHRQLLKWKKQGVRISALVYDVLPIRHPHWFKPVRRKTFEKWLYTLAIYADDLICISTSVQQDLLDYFKTQYRLPLGEMRCGVIPLGANIVASKPSIGCNNHEFTQFEHLKKLSFILMVGTIEPRKGYADALSAFDQLWSNNSDIVLVIVGKPGWKTEQLQQRMQNHQEYGKRLYWFKAASDEFLLKLYQSSTGILVASEAEGFGLPLIEALYHGKPVLARDIEVFHEVVADGVVYFKNNLAEALLQFFELCRNGLLRVEIEGGVSTWRDTTETLLKLVTDSPIASNNQ